MSILITSLNREKVIKVITDLLKNDAEVLLTREDKAASVNISAKFPSGKKWEIVKVE